MKAVWLTSAKLRECSLERLDQALTLLNSGGKNAWPLAAYTSGVAVECAMRARRRMVSDQINARHRLQELATEANYSSRLKGASLARYNADLDRLDRLWDNLLRYCSLEAYLEFLERRLVRVETLHGRLKSGELAQHVGSQDAARIFSEETYNSAVRLVSYGEPFWKER